MKRALCYFLIFFSVIAKAGLVRVPYEGVRATGMGNAYVALAEDQDAVWYNPAALARVKGGHFTLFDFTAGADGSDTLNRMKNTIFNGDYTNLMRTTPEFARIGIQPTFVMPYFSFSIFEHGQSFNSIDLTSLNGYADIDMFNDLGAIAGVGIPLGDYLSIGFSVRAMEHSAVDTNLTVQELLNIAETDPAHFENNVYNTLKSMMGTGWGMGLTAGALLQVPLPAHYPKWKLAATVEDLGETTFHKIGTLPVPPPLRPNYIFGTLLQYDLPRDNQLNLTLDLRNNFQPLPFVETFHCGAEYRTRYFSVRGGIYQGYFTYGLSIETPPHTRIHFSSYGVELGNGFRDHSQRWYLVQLEIGFNPL